MFVEMLDAYKEYWERYVDFSGRSGRAKYWWVVLINIIISTIFGFFGSVGSTASVIYSFVTLVPGIALAIRRLHDIKKSGWNLLWAFLPLIGWIILIVYLASESKFINRE